MRRLDQSLRRPRSWNLGHLRTVPLPAPVYREFVDMLFGMRLPVLAMGLVLVGIAALTALEWGDAMMGGIALAATLVTAARILVINAYQRARPVRDLEHLRRWELRYAVGNYAFAILLGLLNVRALMFHDPILHLITVSLVFGFGAGIVSRISVRPVICVVSLLLATMPTVGALAIHTLVTADIALHTEMFAIEALLVALITALSLQTVAHLYRSAVLHHTAKHDMAQLARCDALTGLPNRLLLRERFQESSVATARSGGRMALHFIDLDGFKSINDVHGHPAGDSVLLEVSRRLQESVRSEDTVARLGGDEFIIVQTNVIHSDEAGMLARRIIKRLSAPYEIEGVTMRISASVGIAMTPEFGQDLERLISCADAALYRSKNGGKGRLHFCTDADAADAEQAAA